MEKVTYFEYNPKTKKPIRAIFVDKDEKQPENTTTLDPYAEYIDPYWDGDKWNGAKTYADHNKEVEKRAKNEVDEDEAFKAALIQKVMMLEARLEEKA